MEVAHRSGWNRLSTLPFGFRFWKPIAIEPNRRSFRFRRFLRDNNSQTLSRVRYRLGFRPSRIYFRSALGGSCGFRAFRQRPATRRKSFSKSKSMSPWTLMVSFCFAFCFFFWRSGFQVLGSGASPLLRFTCIETSTMTRRGLTGHIRRGYRRNRRFQEKTVACMGGALFFFPVHNNTQTLP